MPSPNATKPISILIHRTKWLDPVESEALILPPSIPPGHEVVLPGRLRALIKNEDSPRKTGHLLRAYDELSFAASFSSRLKRCLPGFSKSRRYLISYPIELAAPVCLESAQQGDTIRAFWTLKNVSNRMHSSAERYIATRLSDPSGVLRFPSGISAGGSLPMDAVDTIETIQPGAEVMIERLIAIPSTALEYRNVDLRVELLLDDPHNLGQDGQRVVRSAMSHAFRVQVASAYKYDPTSHYLLIVNSRTSNAMIREIKRFIVVTLRLRVDIYNLSLTGTIGSVLQNYRGKSVIVCGNAYDFSEQGSRYAWHIMGITEIHELARSGTSFFFCGVANKNDLKRWASQVIFAMRPNINEHTLSHDFAELVSESAARFGDFPPSSPASYGLQPKLSCMDKLRASLPYVALTQPYTYARRVTANLNQALPLQRFLVGSTDDDDLGNSAALTVLEALPKTSRITYSTEQHSRSASEPISEHLKYGVISSLPYQALVSMFWDWAPPFYEPTDQQHDEALPTFTESQASQQSQTQVSHASLIATMRTNIHQLLNHICRAVEAHLGAELMFFLEGKPTTKDYLSRLPKLNLLLSTPARLDASAGSLPDDLHLMVFGTVFGALRGTGIKHWLSNAYSLPTIRRTLAWQVSSKLKETLREVCGKDASIYIMAKIAIEREKTVKAIKSVQSKDSKSKLGAVLALRQTALTGTQSLVVNLAGYRDKSRAITSDEYKEMLKAHESRAWLRETSEAQAAAVLARHLKTRSEITKDNDRVRFRSES